MLAFFKLTPALIFLSLVYSSSVFSRAEFDDGYKATQEGNYERAISLWKPLAEKGDAAAQYTLGWMYESGQGIEKDDKKAALWYTKSAQQGNMAAQYVLATMYSKGRGVIQNTAQAINWYTQAANQGDAIAQFKLGEHYQQGDGVELDYKQGISWIKKAADQGHIMAQIRLGKIYESGMGTTVDYEKAINWYKKSVAQSSALGQYHLAHMYEAGLGIEQDLNKAKSLYLHSAKKDNSAAAYKVGELYELGKGNEVDYQNAIKWYQKAARKSHNEAQFKLGTLYQEGKGATKDIRTAITWYNQSITQNNPQAHYRLGTIYVKGIESRQKSQSIKINYNKAFHHFQESSNLGYKPAHAQLGYLYEQGFGTDIDLAKALSLYQQSTGPWAAERYQALNARLTCYETATTELFSVQIACTTREVLSEKIKESSITAIDENSNNWSDTYFTGAVIRGSSQLEVTYTRDDHFVSAEYTFVGRNDPTLISKVKVKLMDRYGKPHLKRGEESEGPSSFKWVLDDGVHLILTREWPDTTTYVRYFLPEKIDQLSAEQEVSIDKNYVAPKKEYEKADEMHIF